MLLVYVSITGFTCEGKKSFQCDNGQCVSKELVCDGDKACDDNSDEKNCECFTTQFMCPNGGCLDVKDLCHRGRDCDDKTDESRCGKKELLQFWPLLYVSLALYNLAL